MKKITILALCLILAVGMLAGCRGNVADETVTPSTSKATMPSTTQTETTRATEATRHTTPSETTNHTTMPSIENGTTDGTHGTDATGRERHLPPRY